MEKLLWHIRIRFECRKSPINRNKLPAKREGRLNGDMDQLKLSCCSSEEQLGKERTLGYLGCRIRSYINNSVCDITWSGLRPLCWNLKCVRRLSKPAPITPVSGSKLTAVTPRQTLQLIKFCMSVRPLCNLPKNRYQRVFEFARQQNPACQSERLIIQAKSELGTSEVCTRQQTPSHESYSYTLVCEMHKHVWCTRS